MRFRVASVEQVHAYYVDGCGGDGLQRGDLVFVHFDPQDPSDFLVDGEANEAPVPTLVAVIALVAIFFFSGGAALGAWRLHGERRLLTTHPWIQREARVVPFASPWTRGREAVEFCDGDHRTVLVTQAQSFGPGLPVSPTGTRLLAAGQGDACVLRTRQGDRLIFARAPRAGPSSRRARRALDQR